MAVRFLVVTDGRGARDSERTWTQNEAHWYTFTVDIATTVLMVVMLVGAAAGLAGLLVTALMLLVLRRRRSPAVPARQ